MLITACIDKYYMSEATYEVLVHIGLQLGLLQSLTR